MENTGEGAVVTKCGEFREDFGNIMIDNKRGWIYWKVAEQIKEDAIVNGELDVSGLDIAIPADAV
ncbi:MAG: hypothetical protein STSR0009_02190 [Methanoregula sp.]